MSGQNGAKAAIIGILVIGFSVTRMTRNFVSEEGRLATGGMPPPVSESSPAEAYAEEAVPEVLSYGEAEGNRAVGLSAFSEGAGAGGFSGPDEAREAQPSDFSGEAPADVQEIAIIVSEESASEDRAEVKKAKSETVKSPLETAASGAVPGEQTFYESISIEELRERLSQASEQAARYRERTGETAPDRNVSLHLSAEYEKELWNHELDLICSCIRARPPGAVSEKLRQEELEWLRQRDLAADRAAAEKKSQSAMETAWAEAAAGMTKERCYSLLTDYEELFSSTEALEETLQMDKTRDGGGMP